MAKKVKKEKKLAPEKAKVAPAKKASKIKSTSKAHKSSALAKSAPEAKVAKTSSTKLSKKASANLTAASSSKEKKSENVSLKAKNEKSVEKASKLAPAITPPKLGILQKKPSVDKAKVKDREKGKINEVKTESTSDTPINSHSAKWLQLYKKYGNLEAAEYDMTRQFEERKPIQHPRLGWGFILSIVNDRLEVLFQEGIKTLISNYNPDLKI